MSPKQGSKKKTSPPGEWAHGLLSCCSGPDVGLNCCIQNCCCQPCVWGSSLNAAGNPNGTLLACLSVVTGANAFALPCISYVARRDLMERYKIKESVPFTCFISCCCTFCSRVQEIDTVLKKENRKYACAGTVSKPALPKVPYAKTMKR